VSKERQSPTPIVGKHVIKSLRRLVSKERQSPTPFVHAGAFEWTGKMIQAWNKREHMQLGLEVLESSNCDCSYCYTWVGCNTKTFFLFLGNPKKKPKKKGVEL